MSDIKCCIYCVHSNPLREKDGHVRCERFSEWHHPITTIECEAFIDRGAAKFADDLSKLKEEK